ncbi:unnamed protein product [Didymodactylos carnosus]|uniref:NAD(P)(+)--arginine ADP-ribosyltransferase n=1 Tax=Didymodactylos carnosus TaxID=1234261 RepID=A0A8S2SJC2_9BILA|nr:unnamed protein product [Didymodactylos carnosus]CAF4225280.1 unnamed protein product [Didymodactylos carnosus]
MMTASVQDQRVRISSHYTDVIEKPMIGKIAPIKGYENEPLVSLEKAIEPIAHLFNSEIWDNVETAKEKCRQPADNLTQDESASIYLYTMEFDGSSLYLLLNQTLRSKDTVRLKPWFLFLKLFLTALYKLPSKVLTVWRGIRNVGVDVVDTYHSGIKFVEWAVTSCTKKMEVLENEQFLGNSGMRILFSIQCINGKSVSSHSQFQSTEEEIILMPGSFLKVTGSLKLHDMRIVQCKEIIPTNPLIAPPFIRPKQHGSQPTKQIQGNVIKIKNEKTG